MRANSCSITWRHRCMPCQWARFTYHRVNERELARWSFRIQVMHHTPARCVPASPLRNVGYIGSFWTKIDRWDNRLVRKAGGVFPRDDADLGFATFTIANASSVMALIRAVCGEVMRENSCPLPLAIDFTSLKITWLFSAQATQMRARPTTSLANCHAPPESHQHRRPTIQ